jgi:nucleoside recognition membrane protein YjiH
VDDCTCELWSRSIFAAGALSNTAAAVPGGIDTGAHRSNVKVVMTSTLLSRDGASAILLSIMAICLPLAVAGQMTAIFLQRGPVRYDLSTASDVFGWLFTIAFILTMLLTISVEERRLRRRAR